MSPRRPRFRVPERLAVSVLVTLASACENRTTTDAAADTASDTAIDIVIDAPADLGTDIGDDTAADAMNDVPGPCDAQPYARGTYQCVPSPGSDAGACPGQFVCSPSMCAAGCAGCALDETNFHYGLACLADRDTDAHVDCPAQVCTVADCPSGCHSCPDTLFCIPDSTSDVRVASCTPSVICTDDPLGCETGCTPVG